jgi:pimeloyl-ACP methyl ester carboxylesterase
MWRLAPLAGAYRRLASFARVIVFDRRGTGLSDRIDGANLPTLEARMDDIRAVMDAAEVERAALFGHEDGALLCAVFAATHPSRTFAAVLHGTGPGGSWAPDYPWGWTAEQWDEYLTRVDLSWGTDAFARYLIEETWSSHVGDVDFRREFASFLRVSASPGAAVVFESLYRETDIRDILGTIHVPVLVMHSVGSGMESIECARYLAAHIPGAHSSSFPAMSTSPSPEIRHRRSWRRSSDSSSLSTETMRRSTASSRRFCLRMSSARPRRLSRWVIAPGEISLRDTINVYAHCSDGSADGRSTLLATASWRSSMAGPGRPLRARHRRSTSPAWA